MANADLSQRALQPVAPILKQAGFKKRGATFNRSVGDGMTHVVNYQRSPYDPTSFTINLGVHIPSMNRTIQGQRDWYVESQCQLGWRIGQLISGADKWWSVDDHDEVMESATMLLGVGLQTLSGYSTSADILNAYDKGGRAAIGPAAPADLDFVDLYEASGRSVDAQKLLEHEIDVAVASGGEVWIGEVRRYLLARGRSDLTARLE